jgi:hypothetical protein
MSPNRLAHFVDQQRQLTISAIAEIDRQRIEGVAAQAGIAEQQHGSAREVDAASGRATLRVGKGNPSRLPWSASWMARCEIRGLFPKFQISHRHGFDLRERVSQQGKNLGKPHEIFVRFQRP